MTGEQLRGWRTRQRLTQQEAADSIGVSQEMWAMVESGRKSPPKLWTQLLAKAKPRSLGKRGSYSG